MSETVLISVLGTFFNIKKLHPPPPPMNSQPHEDDDSDDEINPFKCLMSPNQHQDPSPAENPPSFSSEMVDQNSYYLTSINSNLVVRQLPSQGLSFQLWPAATALVNLLESPNSPLPELFSRKDSISDRRLRILELGSGTGLVGIAAAALLGANVTVTDLPHVLPNLQFNIEANSEIIAVNGGLVNPAALSWGETEHMEAIGGDFDIILGSDVVYHDNLYDPLIETLRWFLLGNGNEKKVVFFMAHLRRWKKESAFFKKAKKLFDVQVIHSDPPFPGSRVGVVVYKFAGNRKKL